MTSTKHLLGMIQSHATGDDDRFLAIAENIASDADRSGRVRVAGEIRSMVERVRRDRKPAAAKAPIPLASRAES